MNQVYPFRPGWSSNSGGSAQHPRPSFYQTVGESHRRIWNHFDKR